MLEALQRLEAIHRAEHRSLITSDIRCAYSLARDYLISARYFYRLGNLGAAQRMTARALDQRTRIRELRSRLAILAA